MLNYCFFSIRTVHLGDGRDVLDLRICTDPTQELGAADSARRRLDSKLNLNRVEF